MPVCRNNLGESYQAGAGVYALTVRPFLHHINSGVMLIIINADFAPIGAVNTSSNKNPKQPEAAAGLIALFCTSIPVDSLEATKLPVETQGKGRCICKD